MKKCSHCKTIIDDDYIRCPICDKYVDNEIFKKLDKKDIKKIRKNNLSIYTPKLLALELRSLYPEDVFSEIKEKYKDKEIQYNYFLFNNYMFYKCSILRVNIKKNCYETITNEYRDLILSISASLFLEQDNISYSYEYLFNQAQEIFNSLDDAMMMGSPQQVGLEFSKIIFGESDALMGYELHLRITTYFDKVDTFSSMFLVEEDDWDWEKIIDKEFNNE